MTTDEQHTMLTLAAKAAGKVIDKSEKNGGGKNNTGFDILGNAVLDWHNAKVWNPITSSADCGELEAKLVIDVHWGYLSVAVTVESDGDDGYMKHLERYHDHNGDRQAARRMAVTKLAAKIGEMMG